MCKSDVTFSYFVNIIHWYYSSLSLSLYLKCDNNGLLNRGGK